MKKLLIILFFFCVNFIYSQNISATISGCYYNLKNPLLQVDNITSTTLDFNKFQLKWFKETGAATLVGSGNKHSVVNSTQNIYYMRIDAVNSCMTMPLTVQTTQTNFKTTMASQKTIKYYKKETTGENAGKVMIYYTDGTNEIYF